MIGYVTIGTNDLARAAAFYDALLATVGATRMMEGEGFVVWSAPQRGAALMVTTPNDKRAATVGNGAMVALAADSAKTVDAVHAKALALGAKDEGAPGPRGDNFYGGYFRDLDGNKLNAFFMG
jgi:predicted lactoylglutathione lyase